MIPFQGFHDFCQCYGNIDPHEIPYIAIISTFGSAVAMGTASQTSLFFSQLVVMSRVKYNDLPAFTFFVIANSIVCGYLVFSLPLAIFHSIKGAAKIGRTILLIFDTVMLVLLTAGASAATAIVYLAHKGNPNTNWIAVCQQLSKFCGRISGSLIGSFAAVLMLMLILVTSSPLPTSQS